MIATPRPEKPNTPAHLALAEACKALVHHLVKLAPGIEYLQCVASSDIEDGGNPAILVCLPGNMPEEISVAIMPECLRIVKENWQGYKVEVKGGGSFPPDVVDMIGATMTDVSIDDWFETAAELMPDLAAKLHNRVQELHVAARRLEDWMRDNYSQGYQWEVNIGLPRTLVVSQVPSTPEWQEAVSDEGREEWPPTSGPLEALYRHLAPHTSGFDLAFFAAD